MAKAHPDAAFRSIRLSAAKGVGPMIEVVRIRGASC
jgi:hypothetical protein